MKAKIITFIFLASIFSAVSQNKVDTLTNESIIQLTKVGLSPSVIVTKIQSSFTKFDISTSSLINLSNAKVAPEVINEMMKTVNSSNSAAANQVDLTDPHAMHPAGIYYYSINDKVKPVKKLYATVVSSGQSGGVSLYGIGSSSATSNLSGETSRFQISENSPTFYFYFQHSSTPSAENWWFATAETPNEFVLVQLYEKNDSRYFKIGGGSSIYGISSGHTTGIPEKDKVHFEMIEISTGIFKVTFNELLDKGEYCFIYGGAAPSIYANNKVFDFTIINDPSKEEKAKAKNKKKSTQVY